MIISSITRAKMMQPCITNHFSQIYHEEKGDKVNDNAMNTVKENIYVVDLYFILLGEAQINYIHNEVKEGIYILEDHLKGHFPQGISFSKYFYNKEKGEYE